MDDQPVAYRTVVKLPAKKDIFGWAKCAIETENIDKLKSIVADCNKMRDTDALQGILLLAAAKGSKFICDFLIDQRLPSTSGCLDSNVSQILFGGNVLHLFSPLSVAVYFNKIENIKSLLPWAQDSDIEMIEQQQEEVETLILDEIQKRLETKFRGRTLGIEAGFRNEKSVLVVYTESLDLNPFETKEYSFCGRSYILRNPKMIREPNPEMFARTIDLSEDQIEGGERIIYDNASYLWSHHSNLNIITMRASNQKACIILCCTSKGIIPIRQKKFPKTLSTNDNKHTLPVLVEEGFFELCPSYDISYSKEFHQHLKMGCSISPANTNPANAKPANTSSANATSANTSPGNANPVSTGTLGPFIDINGQPGFLTCAHVLFDLASGPLNYNSTHTTAVDVLQPEFGSLKKTDPCLFSSRTPCGTVVRAVFNPQDEFSVDAAAVLITDDSRIPEGGYFTVDSMESYKNIGFNDLPVFESGLHKDPKHMPTNRKVIKCGKETHLTQGFVKCWGAQVMAMTGRTNVDHQQYAMKDQIEVYGMQPYVFSQPGDSGSAVFQVKDDTSLECIGMAIGNTSYNSTIVTPISAILRKLGPEYSLKKFQHGSSI